MSDQDDDFDPNEGTGDALERHDGDEETELGDDIDSLVNDL
jgi:hypothetical protein